MSVSNDDPPRRQPTQPQLGLARLRVAKKKASKKESVMKRFVRLITRKKKN